MLAPTQIPQSICGSCTIRQLCLPTGLTDEEINILDQHVIHRKSFKKNEVIFPSGEPFHSLYMISTGQLKTTVLHNDGRAQVTGFYLGGDVLGLDAISTQHHPSEAVALCSGALCQIPFAAFNLVSHQIPNLQHQFISRLSNEIVHDQDVMILLGSMTADERLATFLLNLSKRLELRQHSPTELTLYMTRDDMGSYLGLKLETVSRALSRFHDQGLLFVKGRHIQILDAIGLHSLIPHR
jgi:CRP/FNR family transcriptional regulator